MTYCWADTKDADPNGYHVCWEIEGHGTVHLCNCGFSWGSEVTVSDERSNELELNLKLSQKDLNALYIVLSTQVRITARWASSEMAKGRLTQEQGFTAVENVNGSMNRVLGQITDQFPFVTARADQIAAEIRALGFPV